MHVSFLRNLFKNSSVQEDPVLELQLSNISSGLEQLALLDNKLTGEEKTLLNRIKQDISAFESSFNRLLKLLPDETLQTLFQAARQQIIENAYVTASDDEVISEDEQKIIEKLAEDLEKFQIDKKLLSMQTDNWFAFKVVIWVSDPVIYPELFNKMDNVYCNRNILPEAGVCLGTKHFEIYSERAKTNNQVSILLFLGDDRVTETRSDWINKGAFGRLEVDSDETIDQDLEKLATDILDNFFDKKFSEVLLKDN